MPAALPSEAALGLLEGFLEVCSFQERSLYAPLLPLLIATILTGVRPQQGSGGTREMAPSGEG